MIRTGLLTATALRSALVVGFAVAMTAPAVAQDAAEENAPATLQSEAEIESGADASDDGVITVTGSRIRRPNLESAVPVTSLGGEEFFETGQTSIGDVLNELPALRTTFSQANSTRFLGTAGLNLLDLRGLGTQRTLVLQNGRRHVAADILSNAVSVDTNQIPTDLIERVDIVTGGSSSVYGSDAIAGVVNFVLKRDFEGIQVRGQGGVSKYGDAGSYYVSALAGTNFADGRGNIALNLEYAHNEDFYAANRPNLRQNDGFVTVDSDSGANLVNGGDGNPDRVFMRDIRSAIYTNGGGIENFYTSPFFTPFIFTPDGRLIPQTGQRVGLGPNGSFIGGNGDNFRSGKEFGLYPKLDRYSANLIAHFTISEAFEPFVEAKYVRTDSLGSASGPAFMARGGTFGSSRERFFTDNPFLTDQARGVIRDAYGDYYDAAGDYVSDGINDADQRGFYLNRNIVELGVRQEEAKRETYRIVGGVRGDFNDDWSYEAFLNYGEFTEDTKVLGNLNVQRFLLAIDAVRNPAGNIVCRATIDPAARIALESATDTDFAAAALANDVASCVPINLFGSGNITDAARNYVIQDTVSKGKITQFNAGGFLAGDLSSLFELPGGPIGFVVGAEYRRETAFQAVDPLVEAGLTFYNAIPAFDPPSFEVKEAYGELRIPILRDTPFFQNLTVNLAGRVSDYKGATGTTYAYNGSVEWAPIEDVRFRAAYARSVRAPNLVELYGPLGQNFAPAPLDPCAADNINAGSPTRAANCAAAGISPAYNFQYAQSLQIVSGGNVDLKEEKSDSYTIGAVVQPRIVPGFALSVDYYDITVDDVITAPTAQQILNACYDAADLNNQFCDLFQRAGPGGGPRGEEQFRVLEGSLQQVLLNYAKLKVRGIDVEASYRRNIGGIGNLSTRFTYTHVFQNDQFLFPDDPGRADQILLELGDPEDAFNWNVQLDTGPFKLGYQMRYLGKQLINGATYEDFFPKQDRPAQNIDYAERRFYPAVFYHDIRLGIDANDRFNFYVGVDNVLNRQPPFGQTGIGGGSGVYSNIGRFFYAGAKATF